MKQCQYQKHDLVYAKIRGYPWWPGIVREKKNSFSNEIELTNTIVIHADRRCEVEKCRKR